MAGAEWGGRIRRIQAAANIRDVAKRLGMGVVKRGSSHLSICPFHSDTSPSLTLYDAGRELSHFHCFACGAHGDAFALVQQVRGVSFPEAADWLAQQYGLMSPIAGKDLDKDKQTTNARLHGLSLALEIFRSKQLRDRLGEFLSLRELPIRSGDSPEILYVPGNTLLRELRAQMDQGGGGRELQGYLEAAGLLRSYATAWSETSNFNMDVTVGLQDFFADDRVLFPLRNRFGGLVGFAGRRADWLEPKATDTPKYLYSPGTPKGEILYRAQAAFEAILAAQPDAKSPQELFLVEGLVDAIRLEAVGLSAVAILGAQSTATQNAILHQLAQELPSAGSLGLSIFLDRDKAGIRGAAKLVTTLHQRGLASSYIWPTPDQLIEVGVDASAKDPDEILRKSTFLTAAHSIASWRHPSLLVLLADQLGVDPNEILDRASWARISKTRRARALSDVASSVKTPLEFLVPFSDEYATTHEWFQFVKQFFAAPELSSLALRSANFLSNATARLNHARALACSGVQRGDMAPDLATWRRLDILATAFNEAIKSRFRQKELGPIEPFDAMFVSRGFGKSEYRLKVMPCPEDLVVQQYLINSILTEGHDNLHSKGRFSNHIPAVRYYRDGNKTVTTGSGSAEFETLSFAYQLDMDVLEGRLPPTGNGIFRPYFNCWKDFVGHLRRSGEQMRKVHVLRLDARRYYDELGRGVVRDILLRSLGKAVETLDNRVADWIPLLAETDDKHRQAEAVVDWLCDQSFGFSYFDPETGERRTSPEDRGIPQGPVLSAWLGSIALFPLDELMRTVIKTLNADSETKCAAYGRYVDDVILIADSPEILAIMRARAEDAVRHLSLTLIQKADAVPPMSSQEFSTFLTEGRAFATSEPDAEPVVFDAGDGEAGWQMWGWGQDEVLRKTSLHLLHDNRLYDVDHDQAIDHLYTALRAGDLRPKDLAKAARWLWLHSAIKCNKNGSEEDLWDTYIGDWQAITNGSVWHTSDVGSPWEDPAFYALEGLEKLFDIPQGRDPVTDGRDDLIAAIKLVANQALRADFIERFRRSESSSSSPEWGMGVRRLRRMFWNHALPLRMKAVRILGDTGENRRVAERLNEEQSQEVRSLSSSLARARITDFEATGLAPEMPARSEAANNPLHIGMIWLHVAFVLFLNHKSVQQDGDPLDGRLPRLYLLSDADPIHRVAEDRFIPLLRLLQPLPDLVLDSDSARTEICCLALATLSALAPWDKFTQLLSRRETLVAYSTGAASFPVLPGIAPDEFLMIGIDDRSRESQFVRVDKLKLLGIEEMRGDVIHVPLLSVIDSQVQLELVGLNWRPDDSFANNASTQLILSHSEVSTLGFGIYLRPPTPKSPGDYLALAADLFEALAYLNDPARTVIDAEPTEFVPAWPYFALEAELDGIASTAPLRFSLMCLPVRSSVLGGQGFVRTGSRGLQPVSIPSEQAHLWRAGVAISDLVGLSDDVDRSQRSLDSSSQWPSIADEVMLHSMRRLRGCFLGAGTLRVDRKKPYLPATISRVLQGMREYPGQASQIESVSFILALRNETNAMALRLDANFELGGQGGFEHLLERAARLTVQTISPSHLDAVPLEQFDGGIIRQTTLGWRLLASRLEKLPPPAVRHVGRAWTSLIAGINIASVSSWLRALAFELSADDSRPPVWSNDLALDVTNIWGIDSPCLSVSTFEDDVRSLSSQYRDAFLGSGHRAQTFFENITALGWLAIVSDMLGMFSLGVTRAFSFKGAHGSERLVILERDVGELARVLSSACESSSFASQTEEDWPFELSGRALTAFDSDFYERAQLVLTALDEYCGYAIERIVGNRWSFDPATKSFISGSGDKVPLLGWQVQGVGAGGAWSESRNGRFVSNWTETRNSNARLLGVSVWRKSFGDLVRASDNVASASPLGVRQLGELLTHALEADPSDAPDRAPLVPNDARLDDAGAAENQTEVPLYDESQASERASYQSIRARLRGLQSHSWRSREKQFDGQIRVALLQWQVDDTYRHPVFDTTIHRDIERGVFGASVAEASGKGRTAHAKIIANAKSNSAPAWDPEKSPDSDALLFAQACASTENRGIPWSDSRSLPSWAENRRRRIIGEAMEACNKLNVDVLVLPEYSVRPDTVVWIAGEARSKGYKASVYAGTYRLFGSSDIPGFSESFSEAFGYADHRMILAGESGGYKLVSSGERSSILSLISPVRTTINGMPESTVSVFTRRKKYPAAAANEIFNPSASPWSPMYTLDAAMQDIRARGANGLRALTKAPELSAADMLKLVSQHIPEQHFAELICSEIFLATSPANTGTLADHYQQLLARFGQNKKMEEARKEIMDDVGALGRALSQKYSASNDSTSLMRRTVLIVPAMTSRSADYWIFGQTGLLAAGLTTVFCNASCKKESVGGSCVIGNSSWKDGVSAPGMHAHITPYSGWSRGIYYNKASDALGPEEQALVVVDMDPLYMNEGKPRPQTLHAPLQLVAHIPIIETLLPHDNPGDAGPKPIGGTSSPPLFLGAKVASVAGEFLKFADALRASPLWDPHKKLDDDNDLLAVAKKMCVFTADSEAFEARLDHWRDNWRDLPWASAPPAVIDFLWVDHSNSAGLPLVFIPPWSSSYIPDGTQKGEHAAEHDIPASSGIPFEGVSSFANARADV